MKAFDLFFAWATEKVAWCSCMGIRYYFNTKYFIINSRITALCNRNRSAVLAYIYTHTHTSSCWRESDDAGHTYTHSCPPLILRVHEHTHIWCAHLQPFQECFHNTHTQVAVYWRFGWWWHAHTHSFIHASLLAQTHISPSCLQERFPCTNAALHATCVLISPVCEESSYYRRSYSRLYCETSGRGAPVF